MNWKQKLAEELPLLGHRNWIVVADAAYPAQSRAGIETVATSADQLKVVKALLDALDGTKHVRPAVYLDAELQHVEERYAPGINTYRDELSKLLNSRPVTVLPHEQIIARLDQAGAAFRVLILKTNLTLPYTSVFCQLDCGYWSEQAEQALRDRMENMV
jgi:L-fucose mutarotase/ribose pyranase (RbsD/FucU family)